MYQPDYRRPFTTSVGCQQLRSAHGHIIVALMDDYFIYFFHHEQLIKRKVAKRGEKKNTLLKGR